MKKQHRTLIVVFVAVLTASVASFAMYQAIQRLGVREVEVAHTQVVVAAQTITMGTRLHENHLRLVDWPSRNPVPGAFSDPQKLIDRGVIVPIAENEPITANKLHRSRRAPVCRR
jgi:Flp pilus assembly protein CpaB